MQNMGDCDNLLATKATGSRVLVPRHIILCLVTANHSPNGWVIQHFPYDNWCLPLGHCSVSSPELMEHQQLITQQWLISEVIRVYDVSKTEADAVKHKVEQQPNAVAFTVRFYSSAFSYYEFPNLYEMLHFIIKNQQMVFICISSFIPLFSEVSLDSLAAREHHEDDLLHQFKAWFLLFNLK